VPVSPEVAWKQVEAGKPLKYLLVDTAPSKMMATDDLGNAKFWESLPIQEPHQSNAPSSQKYRDEL